MSEFKLHASYKPTGDQPQAITELVKGFQEGNQFQTLLGVTGSGKTFTMANIIQGLQKPTLVIAHNKTLAAQLYGEFKEMFPENAVEYFVSYYDYYQPEAYVPSTDTYIEKDSSINDEIDKLRHSATSALSERRDVIVVASVSCIYGIGSPEFYQNMTVSLRPGMVKDRDEVIRQLVEIQFSRNDMDFQRGTFRVRGDVLEIFPVSSDDTAIRVEFFGDEIDRISEIDVLTGEAKLILEHAFIYPASHYVIEPDRMQPAIKKIEEELEQRVQYFKKEDKLLEAQRIAERTNFDIEMLRETGFCSGIENYSRHLNNLEQGEPPYTLMDFFPEDYLIIVDESHITIPQVRGMYAGDQSRKETLVKYGFRLPSAKDNRPLSFQEFEEHINQMLFVSATPNVYETEHEGPHRPHERGPSGRGGRAGAGLFPGPLVPAAAGGAGGPCGCGLPGGCGGGWDRFGLRQRPDRAGRGLYPEHRGASGLPPPADRVPAVRSLHQFCPGEPAGLFDAGGPGFQLRRHRPLREPGLPQRGAAEKLL